MWGEHWEASQTAVCLDVARAGGQGNAGKEQEGTRSLLAPVHVHPGKTPTVPVGPFKRSRHGKEGIIH